MAIRYRNRIGPKSSSRSVRSTVGKMTVTRTTTTSKKTGKTTTRTTVTTRGGNCSTTRVY